MTASSSPMFPRRVLASSVILGGCAALGLGVAVPASLAAGTGSPKSLLVQAVKDALIQRTVHTDSTARGGSGTLISDVSLNSGTQTLTGPHGALGHVRLIGKTDYLSGHLAGLIRDFGFTKAQAAKIGTHWLVLTYPSRAFILSALDVNLPTTLITSAPAGTLTAKATTTMDGQSVTPIQGSIPKIDGETGTLTLYVSTAAKPLPVAATYTTGKRSSQVTFTHWGEKVTVSAPTDTVTPASLQ